MTTQTVEDIDAKVAELRAAKQALLTGNAVQEVIRGQRSTKFAVSLNVPAQVEAITAEINRLLADRARLTGGTFGRRRAITFG
jgi:hypothetical protein